MIDAKFKNLDNDILLFKEKCKKEYNVELSISYRLIKKRYIPCFDDFLSIANKLIIKYYPDESIRTFNRTRPIPQIKQTLTYFLRFYGWRMGYVETLMKKKYHVVGFDHASQIYNYKQCLNALETKDILLNTIINLFIDELKNIGYDGPFPAHNREIKSESILPVNMQIPKLEPELY